MKPRIPFAHNIRGDLLHKRGRGPRAGGIFKSISARKPCTPKDIQCLLEILLCLAGETYNNIRCDLGIRHRFADAVHYPHKF